MESSESESHITSQPPVSRTRRGFAVRLAICSAIAAFASTRSNAAEGTEDTTPSSRPESTHLADALDQTNKAYRIRPYIHIRSGEYDTVWGVQDLWGAGFGADISPHVSLELAFDSYEKDFDPFGVKQGEECLLSLVPQVRLRLPLANNRVVPYVLAGAGVGWYDFNDPTQNGYGWNFDAQGTKLVISAGVGIDLFLNEHVAFNLEGKYLWLDDLSITATPPGGGPAQEGSFRMADFLGTFGFRAYLDNPHALPLLDGVEHPPVRIYLGVGFGGGVITDSDWIPGVELAHETASAGTIGESAEIAFGANFGRHFGFEIPVDYFESNIELNGLAGVNGGVGEYATYAVVPLVRFRWPVMDGKVVPYAMAGFGATYGEVNDRFQNGSGVSVNSKGFAPAYAAGGGVEYYFNPDVSLFAQAKYIASWNNKIEVAGMGEETGDLSWLHFQLGVRLNLLKLGGK